MTRTGKCFSCFSSVSRPFGHGVQNCFKASHCLLITGGVRWRKLGIFISSAFANFPGAALWVGTHPCLSGSGTVAGWKLLGPDQTAPQSWSTAICWNRGGGTSGGGCRFFRCCWTDLVFLRFKTRNSSEKLENQIVTILRKIRTCHHLE